MSTEKFSNTDELIGHLNSGLLEQDRLYQFFVGENDLVEAIRYDNQWFFTVFTKEGHANHVLSKLEAFTGQVFLTPGLVKGPVNSYLANEKYIVSPEKFDGGDSVDELGVCRVEGLKDKFAKGWAHSPVYDSSIRKTKPYVPYYKHHAQHTVGRDSIGTQPHEVASAQLHRERQTLSKCKAAGILAFSLLVGVGAAALYSWKAGLFAAHVFTLSTIAPPVAIALGVAFLLSMALAAVALCCSRRKKSQSNSWAAFHRSEGTTSGSGKSTIEFDPYFSSATSSFSHQ